MLFTTECDLSKQLAAYLITVFFFIKRNAMSLLSGHTISWLHIVFQVNRKKKLRKNMLSCKWILAL